MEKTMNEYTMEQMNVKEMLLAAETNRTDVSFFATHIPDVFEVMRKQEQTRLAALAAEKAHAEAIQTQSHIGPPPLLQAPLHPPLQAPPHPPRPAGPRSVCRFFEGGKCQYAEECKFKHTGSAQDIPCFYFKAGKICHEGEECQYYH